MQWFSTGAHIRARADADISHPEGQVRQLSSADTGDTARTGRGLHATSGTLYTKGLTQEQVGDVFKDVYGEHYCKGSISRMLDYVRHDVSEWLSRTLDEYYPILFIDCVHIKVHRKRSGGAEAFYVCLAVKEDKTREVIGIFNKPTESAQGWGRDA